jgi:predicted AAA+ superfamily ATPase
MPWEFTPRSAVGAQDVGPRAPSVKSELAKASIDPPSSVWNEHPHRGALWENLVLCEYLKTRDLRPGHNLFFYRDQNAVEIDFVIDEGTTLELIEAKAAERPDPRRLNFGKVAPLFPRHKIVSTLACDARESTPLTMRHYRLVNPLLHDL